jgi:signal transduction histidine kinase
MWPGKNDMTNEQSMAELGSAAAGIAHDLNNQLTLILNYLDISNVEGARTAANRCAALTSSLLSWCRGETMRTKPFDVHSFLFDFIDNLPLPDSVTVALEMAEAPMEIKADPLAVTRVLLNLVLNACHAMDNAGSIVIRAFDRTIEVSDSGPGIAPADSQRIFEPFFSTKGSEGTGLGLAIVRETMRKHGGEVSFRNGLAGGATFSLRFRQ